MNFTKRLEYKSQVFFNDVDILLSLLNDFDDIDREYVHTITIYFKKKSKPQNVKKPLRFRFYCNLKKIDSFHVKQLVSEIPLGKLQLKKRKKYVAISEEVIETFNASSYNFLKDKDGSLLLIFENEIYVPTIIRVAVRKHFKIKNVADKSDLAPDKNRITLDLKRHDFMMDYGSGDVIYLGELGPKIEIKSTDFKLLKSIVKNLSEKTIFYSAPFSALQLYYLQILQSNIKSDIKSYPEIEIKFNFIVDSPIEKFIIKWLIENKSKYKFLLPYPYYIERVRRCYACSSTIDAELIAVETLSGKISAKVKKNARMHGAVIIRDTDATLRTDLESEVIDIDSFLKKHNWVLNNDYIKHQKKIPFSTASGHAFLFSIDCCSDNGGHELRQLEVEYIGSTTGAEFNFDAVMSIINTIKEELVNSEMSKYLSFTNMTKFQFFTSHLGKA